MFNFQQNPKLYYKFQKLGWLMSGWLCIAVVIALQKHLLLSSHEIIEHTAPGFWYILKAELFGAFLGSLIGGTLLIFYLHDRFKHRKLIHSVLLQAAIYFAMLVTVSCLASFFYNSMVTGKPFWSGEVVSNVMRFMGSTDQAIIFLNWGIVIILSIWILEISSKFGHGQLLMTFLGTYHKAREETRIFMFIDLKDSTPIAEKLGHEKYFQLLKTCFDEMTDPVLISRGEIYQYIGDEVVISWQLENGLDNNNCIQCFFRIQEKLNERRAFFLSEFGVFPEFKAGVHVGRVMVGEVGNTKRERVFSGDVLNTASRIQGQCKAFDMDLLISGALHDYLKSTAGLKVDLIDTVELRGKNNFVRLFSIEKGKKLSVQNDTTLTTVA